MTPSGDSAQLSRNIVPGGHFPARERHRDDADAVRTHRRNKSVRRSSVSADIAVTDPAYVTA